MVARQCVLYIMQWYLKSVKNHPNAWMHVYVGVDSYLSFTFESMLAIHLIEFMWITDIAGLIHVKTRATDLEDCFPE